MKNNRTVQRFFCLGLLLCLTQNLITAQTIRNQQANLILGNRKTLFMRGSNFGTGLLYTSTAAQIQGLQNAHRTHVASNSYGKAYIQDYVITPIFNIPSVPIPAGNGGIKHLLDSAAVANGYVLADYNYLAYSSRVPFGAGGLGSGNGLKGNLWISDELTFYHPGLVHEFYHAFGLGHAEHIEGGAYVFPGTTLGGLDPYHHIGSDYAGSATTWLKQDLVAYHKYYLGWLETTNITVIGKPTTAAGSTHRIYRHNNLTALAADRKVSLQIGDKFWVSYEPTTMSPDIRKTGVLVHYLPLESPSVTRLLDGTPDSRPGMTKAQQYDDLFDAALAVGETMVFDDISLDVVTIGGTGEDAWVDLRVSSCAAVVGNDTDGDGVCNADDRCQGFDDKGLDTDLDGKPDACDTCPNDPDNDANANGICDNVECLSLATESFEYAASTAVTTAAGGTGLTGNWGKVNADNGILAIVNGTLSYPGLKTKGNSLRIAPTTSTPPVILQRNMTGSYKKGNVFWVSFLLKVNNRNNGSLYIKPNNTQPLAIGKRWTGGLLSIDNTGTDIAAQNGQTYLLVARYKIGATIDTVHLWVNPNLNNFPSLAAANATKTAPTMGTINKFEIYLEGYDGAGDYQIDEFRLGCSPPPYSAVSALSGEINKPQKLDVYPNPTTNKIVIVSESTSNFAIYDILGHQILRGSLSNNSTDVDVSALPTGIYWVRVQEAVSKFVKQ
jgi:Secretion system C-terminal sorting domain